MCKGVLAIQDEASVLDDRAAIELSVKFTDKVATVLFEGPPMARGGPGGLVGLEAATKVIGGEFFFNLRQLVFEADTFLGASADTLERSGQVLGLLNPLGRKFGADGLLEFA